MKNKEYYVDCYLLEKTWTLITASSKEEALAGAEELGVLHPHNPTLVDDDFDEHLGCHNWPNCDIAGCGEAKDA